MAGTKGRPLGSKNNSPFRYVTVQELTDALKPDFKVPVDKKFAEVLFPESNTQEDYNDYEDETTNLNDNVVPQVVIHGPGEE